MAKTNYDIGLMLRMTYAGRDKICSWVVVKLLSGLALSCIQGTNRTGAIVSKAPEACL